MEGERSGAGGGEPPVEDEFACAGVLRGPLASLHGTVERLFGVTFGLGADGGGSHGDGGQIWLKLRGPSGDVRAAKVRRDFSDARPFVVLSPISQFNPPFGKFLLTHRGFFKCCHELEDGD